MALFNKSEELHNRLDWEILQNGWTSLYFNPQRIKEDSEWFVNEDFKVVTFDCRQWKDTKTLHKEIGKGLDFPDYYGGNWSALNDCLWQLDVDRSGLVIVFLSFEILNKDDAFNVLDIFAGNSRQKALFGEKLITLVQVNEPNYECEPVGAAPVMWNKKEWLHSSRGL